MVRVGVWVVTLSVFAVAFLDGPFTGRRLAVVVAASLLVWAPTTVLRFRAVFFPGPPHPRLRDAEGRGWSFRDVVVVLRCGLVEQALASLPWLLLAVWAGQHLDVVGATVSLLVSVWLMWSLTRQLAHVEGEIARLESAVGHTRAARRRLERLLRVRRGAVADGLRSLLASARFRDGDVEGAIEALDAIRDPARWHVRSLRAQMLVGRDPAGARALAASPELSRGSATMIGWLADLHEGHPERVRDAEGDAQALLGEVRPDVAGTLRLLLAAAWAPTDPGRAARYLERAGWSRSDLPWLIQVWPAVGEPLKALRWKEPDGAAPQG